jgi:hypothetical protein
VLPSNYTSVATVGSMNVFVVGLFVGPFLGVALAQILGRSGALTRAVGAGLFGLLLVVMVLLEPLPLELRLGLDLGLVLGALLAGAPAAISEAE